MCSSVFMPSYFAWSTFVKLQSMRYAYVVHLCKHKDVERGEMAEAKATLVDERISGKCLFPDVSLPFPFGKCQTRTHSLLHISVKMS